MSADPHSLQALYPFTSRFLPVSGQRMHYLDEGRGDPILFLHGNPTWSFLYRDYILALRNEHRVIAVDHIGCGLSSKPVRGQYQFTLERRIADLEYLLDHLALKERLALVVHDWGGPIGFGYAVRHPERIRKIAVFNSAAFFWPADMKFPWILRACRTSRAFGWLIRNLNAFAGPASHLMCKKKIAEDARAGYLMPYRTRVDRTAILAFIQDIPLEPEHISYPALMDIQRALPRLCDVPMMIFWGAKDFIFDRHICAEWSRRFPKARVHMFPDAGHNVAEDEKEIILPILREFFTPGSRT